jgi:hypothetical protein
MMTYSLSLPKCLSPAPTVEANNRTCFGCITCIGFSGAGPGKEKINKLNKLLYKDWSKSKSPGGMDDPYRTFEEPQGEPSPPARKESKPSQSVATGLSGYWAKAASASSTLPQSSLQASLGALLDSERHFGKPDPGIHGAAQWLLIE